MNVFDIGVLIRQTFVEYDLLLDFNFYISDEYAMMCYPETNSYMIFRLGGTLPWMNLRPCAYGRLLQFDFDFPQTLMTLGLQTDEVYQYLLRTGRSKPITEQYLSDFL
jgi:hypothetical protein